MMRFKATDKHLLTEYPVQGEESKQKESRQERLPREQNSCSMDLL